MGQKSKIKVIRLVSQHTVEEKVIEVARKKLLLEEMLINPLTKLSKKDLEDVIKIGVAELFDRNKDDDDNI